MRILIAAIVLVSLACGAQTELPQIPKVVDVPHQSGNIYAETYIPTEASTDVNMTVCNSGGWLNIRPEAGDLSISNGELAEGESVTVRMPYTVTEEMGLWGKLVDGRGWINVGYLCEEQ